MHGENATRLTGDRWSYLKVLQTAYKQLQPTRFEDLSVLAPGDLFSKSRSIPELSVVTLRHSVQCKGGFLPEGGKGTVVHVYRDGEHYEVEFAEPFPCTVTVGASDLDPA